MAKRGKSDDGRAIIPLPQQPVVLPSTDGSYPGNGSGDPGRQAQTRNDDGTPDKLPGWAGALDRVIGVQRPAVVANVNRLRRAHPDASPADIIRILERHYLTAVSSGGAAVGASAVIPGVGFATSLGLTGVETIGFLETSALFAQSVTEVHGIAVTDPDRARTLVMAMILGAPGTSLVKQLAAQAGGGPGRSAFWGEMVTSSIPRSAMSGITSKLRDTFIKRFAARQGASVLGRAVPFGIGAVIGGIGNHALGRKIIDASRTAFGPPPGAFPFPVEPKQTRAQKRIEQHDTDAQAPKRRALPWRRSREDGGTDDTQGA
ncbi:hypothetical protein [Curtobacterium sp. Leaf261]|uniref:hypothetical protein n=1 Tax=Curtobacterium sp. Leaf261 TaxID=1736311 RepID=UPI001910641B|nr:hypothetical protein [Curtobacterium sp. Leaf261]